MEQMANKFSFLFICIFYFFLISPVLSVNLLEIDLNLDELRSCRGNATEIVVELRNLSNDNALFLFEIKGKASSFISSRSFDLNLGKDGSYPKTLKFRIPRDVNPGEYPFSINVTYKKSRNFYYEKKGILILDDCLGDQDFTLAHPLPSSSSNKNKDKDNGTNFLDKLPIKKELLVPIIAAILVLAIGGFLVMSKKSSKAQQNTDYYASYNQQYQGNPYERPYYMQYGSYTYPQTYQQQRYY